MWIDMLIMMVRSVLVKSVKFLLKMPKTMIFGQNFTVVLSKSCFCQILYFFVFWELETNV